MVVGSYSAAISSFDHFMAFEFVHRQHTYRKIEPEAIVALQLWPKTGFKKESHFNSPSRDLHQDCIEMDVWET